MTFEEWWDKEIHLETDPGTPMRAVELALQDLTRKAWWTGFDAGAQAEKDAYAARANAEREEHNRGIDLNW